MWIELTPLVGETLWVNDEWIIDIRGNSNGSHIRFMSGQTAEVTDTPEFIIATMTSEAGAADA